MNANNATLTLTLTILPEYWGCYLFVYICIRRRPREVSTVTARDKVGVGKKQFYLQETPRHHPTILGSQDQQIFAVENSVIRIQKYIIQSLKRQRPHLSNNYPSVFKIVWE